MCANLIQRWTVGAGGFIGEVSLFHLSEYDLYVCKRYKYTFVELSNLHVHPLRRGRGWADTLMHAAIAHAEENAWGLFLRCVPYNKPLLTADELIAFYKRYGFKSTRNDPREMLRPA